MNAKVSANVLKDIKNKKDLNEEEIEILYEIGKNYEKGDLFKQDYGKALEIYKICADRDYVPALNDMGWFNLRGFGVDKNPEIATEYFKQAAMRGDALAMVNIGNMYESGAMDEDGEPNWDEAAKWYLLAAMRGDDKGKFNYANCLHYGYGVKQDYDMAVIIFSDLMDRGDKNALFYMELYFENGFGIKKDIQKAVKCYEMGAEAGDAYCCSNLAKLRSDGYEGHEPDLKGAALLYLTAIALGDTLGYKGIGFLYEEGLLGGKEDKETADRWYLMSECTNRDTFAEDGEMSFVVGKDFDEDRVLKEKCLTDIGLSPDPDLIMDLMAYIASENKFSEANICEHYGWPIEKFYAFLNYVERAGLLSPVDKDKRRWLHLRDGDEDTITPVDVV